MAFVSKQITIIGGHYGSGKTEFAVNLALAMAHENIPTRLVDLDIINPYFRSYERSEELEKAGVQVVVTSVKGTADIPALPGEVATAFVDKETRSLFDLGGDPHGARVLGFYEPQLEATDFDFWLVCNANRPETENADKAFKYLQAIESMSKQRITGIVNNTHMARETTVEDILRGEKVALELANKSGLPLVCTTVEERLLDNIEGKNEAPILPLRIYMRKPWELEELEGGLL